MAGQPAGFLRLQGNKEYLQVAHRVKWFREQYSIESGWRLVSKMEQLHINETNANQSFAVFSCEIITPEGEIVTRAYGFETAKDFAEFVLKAETKAIGRALAESGFGTLEALDNPNDLSSLADSPQQRPGPARPAPAGSSPAPRAAAAPAQAGKARRTVKVNGQELPCNCITPDHSPSNRNCPANQTGGGVAAEIRAATEPEPVVHAAPPAAKATLRREVFLPKKDAACVAEGCGQKLMKSDEALDDRKGYPALCTKHRNQVDAGDLTGIPEAIVDLFPAMRMAQAA